MNYVDRVVLCGSNSYDKKYYLNPQFNMLPDQVKEDIKIICVLFTEEVGGLFRMEFNEEGDLELVTEAAEEDILYDEIGAHLLIKRMRSEHRELFMQLEHYYRTFFLDQSEE
jgi:hypothetical protein